MAASSSIALLHQENPIFDDLDAASAALNTALQTATEGGHLWIIRNIAKVLSHFSNDILRKIAQLLNEKRWEQLSTMWHEKKAEIEGAHHGSLRIYREA